MVLVAGSNSRASSLYGQNIAFARRQHVHVNGLGGQWQDSRPLPHR